MPSREFAQCNAYKGVPVRAWIRLRLVALDGAVYELADTGSPCAVILGTSDLSLFSRAAAKSVQSNFGQLNGGWLRLAMPELGLTTQVLGFASDQVRQAAQNSHAEFAGLVGLPLLRLVEYGGNNEEFWLGGRSAVL
jgi:hypothetical protein